jgi:hypothetical protein
LALVGAGPISVDALTRKLRKRGDGSLAPATTVPQAP